MFGLIVAMGYYPGLVKSLVPLVIMCFVICGLLCYFLARSVAAKKREATLMEKKYLDRMSEVRRQYSLYTPIHLHSTHHP